MIKYIIGDLLKCDAKIRCHQVNCKGVMGYGIAKQVKAKYPETFNYYKNLCVRYNADKLLGTVHFTHCKDGTVIANMFSQDEFGADDTLYTDYKALDNCLRYVFKKASELGCSVALPYELGCVSGGGDWNIVKGIIEKHFLNSDIECMIVSLGKYD